MDFLLPIWNPFIVFPLMTLLRAIANPLADVFSAGVAGGLAIILFTIVIRLVLLPLSLAQIRSQKAMMAIQPKLKEIQGKFKNDREGLARAQMELYKERGVNPAAGCLPMLIQLPILFGMYSAMLNLSTQGLTLDQVITNQVGSGTAIYEARRTEEPYPINNFSVATLRVVPKSTQPFVLNVDPSSTVSYQGNTLPTATYALEITPGQRVADPTTQTQPNNASIFLRPGAIVDGRIGTQDRTQPPRVGEPYLVEIETNAWQTRADTVQATLTWDPALAEVTELKPAPFIQENIPFRGRFFFVPSLAEPDLVYLFGFGIPGLLIILMTITSFIAQRMTTMPTEDPQQQAMMRSMAFMPLMYLFFFLQTPAGLVLYWLVSNLATMVQQYFTTGLGLLAGDLKKLTGRDFQPAWAAAPAVPTGRSSAATATHPAVSRNGSSRADGDDDPEDITPAHRVRPTAASRRAQGKGRKRGKR